MYLEEDETDMQTEWTHRIWSDPVPSTSKKGKLLVRGARGRFKRTTPREEEEERVDVEEPGESEKTRDVEEENSDNDSSVEAAQDYYVIYIN